MKINQLDIDSLRFVLIFHILIGMLLCLLGYPKYSRANDQMDLAGAELAETARKSGKNRLAVIDFTTLQGGSSELGQYLADQLTIAIVQNQQGLTVYDRSNLQQILSEHRLSYEGLVDGKDVLKLGQFTAVTIIAVGKIVPQVDEYTISIRLLATDTAAVIGAIRFNIPRTSDLRRLEIPYKTHKFSTESDYKDLSVTTFEEIDGFDSEKMIRIRIVKLKQDIEGNLVMDIIHESLKESTTVSVYKPRTYLVDNTGLEYKSKKTHNIPSSLETDLYRKETRMKNFPQGVGIRYSIIFSEMPKGQDLTLNLSYLVKDKYSKRETLITIPGISW